MAGTCAGLLRKWTLRRVLTQVGCVGADPRKGVDPPAPDCHLPMGSTEDSDYLPLPGTNQAQTLCQEEDGRPQESYKCRQRVWGW